MKKEESPEEKIVSAAQHIAEQWAKVMSDSFDKVGLFGEPTKPLAKPSMYHRFKKKVLNFFYPVASKIYHWLEYKFDLGDY